MNTEQQNENAIRIDGPATKRLGSPLLSDAQVLHLLKALSAGQGNFTEPEADHVIRQAEEAFAAHAFFQLAIDGLVTLKIRASDLEILADVVCPEEGANHHREVQ